RIVLLDSGVVVAEGTVASIKQAAGLTRITFVAPASLSIDGAERDGESLRILTSDAGAAVARLVRENVPLVGLEVRPLTLEEAFLRTLPLGAGARLGARVLSAAVFACAAATTLVAVALATTDAALAPARWAELALVLLLGTAPFALLGIALGYWAPPRAALP